MLQTEYKTVRFNTNLPYNCIYYFQITDANLQLPELDEYDLNAHYVRQVQGFPFHIQTISSLSLEKRRWVKDGLLDSSDKGERADYLLYGLREVFPQKDHSYFLVRLLPPTSDTDSGCDDGSDTFLMAEVGKGMYELAAGEFAAMAAKENFERMTDMPYTKYWNLRLAARRDRSSSHRISGGSIGFLTVNSIQMDQNSEEIVTETEWIRKKYLSSLDLKDGLSVDRLKELARNFLQECDSIGKLKQECPVRVVYCAESQDYEVLVSSHIHNDDIICDFHRTLSKTLYIFFLMHPEGIYFCDLKKYQKELGEIHRKLFVVRGGDPMMAVNPLLEGNVRSQCILDIRSFFEKIFGSAIAGKYCIAKMSNKSRKRDCYCYGINLEPGLIDLGDFKRQ